MENLDELMKKYPLNNVEESKDLRDYTSDNLVTALPVESECNDIDLDWEYPIFNQGNVGSCCGHGGSAVENFIFNVNPVEDDMFSPYWLYAYREPSYHQGRGMFENDISRNLTKIGGVKLKDFNYPGIEYPTIKEKINEIGVDKLLNIAKNYRLESYIHIKPCEVKGWLNEHRTAGFVIVKAYENFYESLNNGGHFPKEGKGRCIGSHCMPFKGVVDGKLKMPNSWGSEVGDNGIFDIDIDSDTIVSVTVFPEARHIRKPIEKKYVAGWNKIDGADWNTAENKWQYSSDGLTLVKNDWIQDRGKWYYLGSDGIMLTGWFKDSKGDWYYLDIDKGYAYTGWVYINGNWYYFDSNCKMLKGWQYINEEWFYLRDTKESDDKPEGSMYIGWKLSQDCSKWYYMNKKGICVHDCTLNIDGKTYSFNSDGAMQEFVCLVTREQLNQVGWYNKYITDSMLADLNNCLQRFNITTPARIRHFISQCSHESGCGYYMVEEASGRAYEYRKDLGNIYSGDGVKYKGAGYIQLTGRANYQSLANYLGDQNVMQGANYVAKNYPWTSAGYWWYKNNMNSLCDSGADCLAVTKRVNGGTNGYKDRLMYYNKCCNIF